MNKTIKSFGYAGQGIRSVFQSEQNMRIHLIVGCLVIIFGFIFNICLTEWMLCLLCFGLVIGMEMMNTAIEKLVDLVSPNHHPIAGKVKDIAAGAVLICAIISVIVGLLIFVPKAWVLLVNFM